MEIPAERTIDRDVRGDKIQSQVIARDWLENSVLVRAVQIQIARSVTPEVQTRQECDFGPNFVNVTRAPARHGAELALLDQAVTKVRLKIQAVGAKES
jgi:hypothetical protein